MKNIREAIKDKARAKRQRKTEAKNHPVEEPKAPATTLTEKAIDMAQGAAAHVGDFVKAAAHMVTGAETVEKKKS